METEQQATAAAAASSVARVDVVSAPKKLRVAAHSHVKGLGLTDDGAAKPIGGGLVGQTRAREAAGIALELIRSKKFAGCALLLAGPPSTGKTALSLALARELGPKVPFCAMTGSDVYSSEVKKTEILMENFRRAIGLRVKEAKEVYEGEVLSLTVAETEAGAGAATANAAAAAPGAAFGKSISHVLVTLKTVKGTKALRLDPTIYEAIQKERVATGDVIYIEANSGAVKRVGRCDAYATEFDLEAEEYVPLPKGDVHKRREVVQDVSLYDLDAANARPAGGSDLLSMLGHMVRQRRTEITEKLRLEVNKTVQRYIDEGIAELVPGVLFIDEVHMLDTECFAYLSRALESALAPIVIFATNRGVCPVRGAGADEAPQPHGMPVDLLDRTLIVATTAYDAPAVAQILALRAQVERVALADDAARALVEHATTRSSVRFVCQLLTPLRIAASAKERDQVTLEDVTELLALFAPAQ